MYLRYATAFGRVKPHESPAIHGLEVKIENSLLEGMVVSLST